MKKNISMFIVILLIFSFIVPVYAMDNQIMIRLPENKQQITTKHIEGIDIESINQLNEEKMFNIVLQLVDYKERVLNYITSEEILEGKESSKIKGYTKILPEGYKIKVLAWDNLKDRNTISNIVEIPIKDGYFVEEIFSIDELDIQIPQWSEYELPKEVLAEMNTGSIKNVPVKWNIDSVDTTKSGKFAIEGNVIGYKEEKVVLNLNINIVEKIVSVEDLNITIDQGDGFSLPSTVSATMSTGSTKNVPVKWNVDTVDTSTAGEYIFEGEVQGYSEKIKLNLIIEEVDLNDVVKFENAELEEIIRDEIDREEGYILKSDLLKVTDLSLQWALNGDLNINDLRHFKNLESLDLGFYEHNFDLTPISNLTNLKSLNLFNNAIDDITPLQNLTNLLELNLGQNQITDIRPLCNLTSLTKLTLNSNKVTDYSPTIKYYDNLLDKDFELNILQADEENIINYNLNLNGKVTLPHGVKLSNGELVFVNWDQEEIIGLNSGVEKVIGHIIDSQDEVYFECTVGEVEEDRIIEFLDEGLEKAVRRTICKNKGDIYYSDVKNLKELNVMAAGVWNLSGIENFKELEKLSLWANNIESSQLKFLKDLSNLKSLDLAKNGLTYIPANAFEDMTELEELVLDENQITEIDKDAFNGLDNLKDLLIEENRVFNIDAVRGLKSLEKLFIRYNNISDISPVEDLTNLKEFWASNNRILDISPLDNLTELSWVYLDKNNISDISLLDNLTKVVKLNITDNSIKNIDVVSNMPNLEWLEAKNNQIENVDCVSELVGLSILDLENNNITNIEALRKLENLTQLYLKGNSITDFSPVADFYDKIKRTDFELN